LAAPFDGKTLAEASSPAVFLKYSRFWRWRPETGFEGCVVELEVELAQSRGRRCSRQPHRRNLLFASSAFTQSGTAPGASEYAPGHEMQDAKKSTVSRSIRICAGSSNHHGLFRRNEEVKSSDDHRKGSAL
jgi:hypothetical protein